MMLITLAARLICNVCCFLYPAYASYKALTYPDPVQDPSGNGGVERSGVERWLMYWAVVGTWTAVEAVAGWTFTWLPFYSIFKTIIFLYLSLPQSEGSTYLYYNHLAPLFNEHERDIDSFLASLRSRASVALVGGAGWLWDKLRSQLAVSAGSSSNDPNQPYYTTDGSEGSAQFPNGTIQPPSLQDPASGAALQLYGFLSRKASTLLPVALTGLQAAWERGQGSRAGGPGPLSGILREAGVGARHETTSEGYTVEYASTIQETIAMPIPRVAPSNENLRSRTFQHGQESLGVTSSHRYSFGSLGTPGSHGRTPSGASQSLPTRGASNRHSSEESLGSRRSSRGDMGSYEDINRAEVLAEEEQQRANAAAAGRPGLPKKRSGSWFGWSAGSGSSGSPDRPKVD